MKYSMTIAYAIQATVLVADRRSNLPVSAAQIAQDGQMPERFLLRILRCLVSARILKSSRGSDGGYSLVRAPANITLLEIIDSVSPKPPSHVPPITAGRRLALDVHLAVVFDRASRAARQEFKKLTVADLMDPERRLSHPA